ncbi:hypothetical protein FSS13T_26400 [Flavobacterium saliperosum S13]|uniref:Uncharacterized protein n=2 Tax=Flavobacterium saliperosum TaxID=329186 RepID=A0A1G4W4K6_9FLAO|nr:hypothetical protein [Flavobacterium saliperosum]ESU21484.1 hypothetical protein FSS13T_26400 [Flavobacterium saliperosum S13]SCX16665.1 hypothetical protein SAMN02927925_02399 [Flavobacterium saliperosum]
MKKLLFGFVAVIAFGLNVSAKEVVSTEKLSEKEAVVSSKSDSEDLLKIKITIDFGRKSKDCTGFGVCSIVLEGDIPLDQISFRGEANSNGNLQLEVTKLGLESIIKTFGSKTIILEEDFTVSSEVCKQIGLKEGYTVKAGKYTVTTDRSGINSVIL